MDILNDILQQSFLRFLWVGSIAGMLLGGGVLFKPQQVMQLNQRLSQWVYSDKLKSLLDRPRLIERFFYRHNRLFGLGVLLGAIYVLYVVFFGSSTQKAVSAFIPRDYWWLSDAVIGMLLVGSVTAALAGGIILARPSLLRDLEQSVNRWVSTEPLTTSFNDPHYFAEQSLLSHHRFSGMAIILGSLYTLVILSKLLFSGNGILF